MSSYYNNIPIYETINISYGNIETLDTTTLKTKNLFIDNVKSSEKIITQNLTLDTDNIESLSKASTAPYTSDNNKITSKGYVDEALSGKASTSDLVGQKYYVEGELKGEIFNNYSNNEASGVESHCEGGSNKATGFKSHCEGGSNKATAYYCHCEGGLNKSTSYAAHCEGYNNEANGEYAHCEGFTNYANGTCSHCEGQNNTASGNYSHCDGYHNTVSGNYSHCEGAYNTLSGTSAHCEGGNNNASGECSHCEGLYNEASGEKSHSEGLRTIASGKYSHSSGYYTASDKEAMFVCGKYNKYDETQTDTTINNNKLFVVGNGTNNGRSDAFVVKSTGEVIINSTANNTTPKLTIGTSKSIIGTTALSSSTQSDDEKIATKYYVDNNAGVGKNYYVSDNLMGEIFNSDVNIASGGSAHAEGNLTTASGVSSHAEGSNTTASGMYSHSEGYYTTASQLSAHSEGHETTASGIYSHSSGYYTVADKEAMFVCGKYNLCDDIPSDPKPDVNNNKLFVVGNGTYNQWSRSDAFVVKSTGEVIINSTANNTTPKLTIGTSKSIIGTTALSSSTQSDDDKIPTKYYVDTRFSKKLDVDYIVFHFCDNTNTKVSRSALGSYIIDDYWGNIIINVNIDFPTINWSKIYLEYITIGDDTTNKYYNYQYYSQHLQNSGCILATYTGTGSDHINAFYMVMLKNENNNYTTPTKSIFINSMFNNTSWSDTFQNMASGCWRLQFNNVVFHKFT